MQFSYQWLKQYVPNLPSPAELEHALIFHAFEVEGLTPFEDDVLLEIKVLPDRAHDCLSHLGIAREASAILNLPFPRQDLDSDLSYGKPQNLVINVEDPKACRRYLGLRVEGVSISESPAWLSHRLRTIGQKSINNVVDATNFVLFDIGQPLHAFDADKVEGGITVRFARPGEKIITLDGRELVLDEKVLIIADDHGPLALAGIKGGNRAEVTKETKNIILESANFDPVLIRRTSSRFGLRTDASKRFENDLSPELVVPAMLKLVDLLQKIAGGNYFGPVDVYGAKQQPRTIDINLSFIEQKLGCSITIDNVKNLLLRLGMEIKVEGENISVIIPYWRSDLQESVNLVEEIGRLNGYDKIKPVLLEKVGTEVFADSLAEKRFAFYNKLREVLLNLGFTEVYGYALTDKGEVALANPLASDKGFLRGDLSRWIKERVNFNTSNVLFDTDPVKIFEIGKIFKSDYSEESRLCLGFGFRKKPKNLYLTEEIKKIEKKLADILDLDFSEMAVDQGGDLITAQDSIIVKEYNLDKLLSRLEKLPQFDLQKFISAAFDYTPISAYPRIIRDIAVWVPEETVISSVIDLIKNRVSSLCVEGPVLFDEFVKDGRKSLAFRLVFQSYEKTLSDEEANSEMEKVAEILEQQSNFEVRK